MRASRRRERRGCPGTWAEPKSATWREQSGSRVTSSITRTEDEKLKKQKAKITSVPRRVGRIDHKRRLRCVNVVIQRTRARPRKRRAAAMGALGTWSKRRLPTWWPARQRPATPRCRNRTDCTERELSSDALENTPLTSRPALYRVRSRCPPQPRLRDSRCTPGT